MRKTTKEEDPDLRPEYDLKLAQRGKYAARFKESMVDQRRVFFRAPD